MPHAHVGGKGVQCLIEVVHLHQDADDHDNGEDIRARVCQLVLPGKSELECNSEPFDGHDGDRADK